jgi:spore maturation protein CgeB
LRGLIDYFNFDFKFLANPLIVKEFQELGYSNINYLPYACDPELHSRPLSYPKTRDVVLVGSIREDRIELANKLKKYNINLELIGGLYREAYIDALASAKIVINQNPEIGAGLLNMRWMETAAAGSIILGEDRDLSVNNLFCFGEAHSYSSIDGLVELCDTYLGQENTQDWIRHISYKNVHKLHTYKNRCEQILKAVF